MSVLTDVLLVVCLLLMFGCSLLMIVTTLQLASHFRTTFRKRKVLYKEKIKEVFKKGKYKMFK